MLTGTASEMIDGARQLREAVLTHSVCPTAKVLNRSAAGLEDEERLPRGMVPRLVLTSPPYPGVHVLYHRWQVDGRKEAPLPFMIANKLDGAGGSYYTMGDRKYPQLKTYFEIPYPFDDVVGQCGGWCRQSYGDRANGRVRRTGLAAQSLPGNNGRSRVI